MAVEFRAAKVGGIRESSEAIQDHDLPRAIVLADEEAPSSGYRDELGLVFSFWTMYGGVVAIIQVFTGPGRTTAPLDLTLFALAAAYSWAALTLPLVTYTSRFDLSGPRRYRAFWMLCGIAMVIATLVSAVLAFAGTLLIKRLDGSNYDFLQLFGFRFVPDLLAALLIFAVAVARNYFVRYQANYAESMALRNRLTEARLEVLRSQLNPHFLFNTLNAVSALVSSDPAGVRRMIARLGTLLRHALDGTSEPEIPLRSELEMLRVYLDILEIRYQGSLKTTITVEGEIGDALVPNLILQPLAENAMKHGVAPAAGYGYIDATAERVGSELVIQVRDSGSHGGEIPIEENACGVLQGGFGLRQTRERLERLYGDSFTFDLRQDSEGGMLAEIRIPYHTTPLARTASANTLQGTGLQWS